MPCWGSPAGARRNGPAGYSSPAYQACSELCTQHEGTVHKRQKQVGTYGSQYCCLAESAAVSTHACRQLQHSTKSWHLLTQHTHTSTICTGTRRSSPAGRHSLCINALPCPSYPLPASNTWPHHTCRRATQGHTSAARVRAPALGGSSRHQNHPAPAPLAPHTSHTAAPATPPAAAAALPPAAAV
jgi:hypothetical protein